MLIAGRFADGSGKGRGHARQKLFCFNGDIDEVFVSDHAGFQTSKSRLHQQNQDGTGQHLGHRLKRWGQWHGIFRHGDSLKDVAEKVGRTS